MSSTAGPQIRLSVSSEPSGAKIFVEGLDTNQSTPAIITVPAKKVVTITLAKDGFYKYQQRRSFDSADSLSASLVPTPNMGYLNIIVRNGGQNPIVFINGTRVNEKLPVVEYAVPAGQELEIIAQSQNAQSTDKTKVTVQANKIQTVELILGPQKLNLESAETIKPPSNEVEKAQDNVNRWNQIDWNFEFRKCLNRIDLEYIPKTKVKMFEQDVPAQEKFCYAYLTLQSKQMTSAQFTAWYNDKASERLIVEKRIYNVTSKLIW